MNMKAAFQLAAVLSIAAVSLSTSSVHAESTQSVQAIPMVIHEPPPDFTWLEFGQNAIGWLAGGAAGGAVECALVGTPVGAACGALVGAAGGLAAGSAYYLATVGYNALIGEQALPVAAPAHALD